jgi:DNA repair protein RecO (recombination protein O)
MVRKTKGIVLRAVRYGETSLIVSVFTEDFGLQSYIINGVRTEKKNKETSSLFTPASLLDLDVYHHEQRGINRIREAARYLVLHSVSEDVVKNNIALFMMELLFKSLKHPEGNLPLFRFCEEILCRLNHCDRNSAAVFPFYFSLHLPHFLGFGISTPEKSIYDSATCCLDLTEGCFLNEYPVHDHFISGDEARMAARLLSDQEEGILENYPGINMPEKFLDFYRLHLQDFGKVRSYTLLQELLSA